MRGTSGVPFGPVLITQGELKGRVAFYDDDEPSGAIVYLEKPLAEGSSYYVVPWSDFRPITAAAVNETIQGRRRP